MQIDLPYLMQDVDRHGNVRLYVRRKNVGKVRLRLPPGAPAFMDEYKALRLHGQAGPFPGRRGFPARPQLDRIRQNTRSISKALTPRGSPEYRTVS